MLFQLFQSKSQEQKLPSVLGGERNLDSENQTILDIRKKIESSLIFRYGSKKSEKY